MVFTTPMDLLVDWLNIHTVRLQLVMQERRLAYLSAYSALSMPTRSKVDLSL
jgi:hypothetical protein